jgi:hypothetical protein
MDKQNSLTCQSPQCANGHKGGAGEDGLKRLHDLQFVTDEFDKN